MLRYIDTAVTFAEIPDEITLCINISGCPNHCKGCHSPYLWKNTGETLNLMHLTSLIDANRGITCICLMGGDQDPTEIDYIAESIKIYYPKLKTAWYSGKQELSEDIDLGNFNFIKLGPYIEDKGPLDNSNTNQRFYKVKDGKLEDCTYLFWKNYKYNE